MTYAFVCLNNVEFLNYSFTQDAHEEHAGNTQSL